MNLVGYFKKTQTKREKDEVVELVGDDPKRFAALVKTFLDGPFRVTQRASWPLTYCVERNPTLIEPHLKKILAFIQKPGVHDAVKRNTLRLLQFVKVPDRFQGLVTEASFRFLNDPKEPVAMKVFAMTVLANIAAEHKDLRNELIPAIEAQLPYGSPAYVSRARKLLRQMKH